MQGKEQAQSRSKVGTRTRVACRLQDASKEQGLMKQSKEGVCTVAQTTYLGHFLA